MEVKNVKTIRIVFKSGAIIVVPYSFKFFADLSANMGKDFKAESPNASVQTKDIQAIVFEKSEDEAAG